MASIFSKIIAGEIPSYTVAESEHFYAFLDINPLSKGHTLVVPKEEVDYFFDLPDQRLGELQVFAARIARSIKHVTNCKRVGQAVLGFEVPHAHLHLVPMNSTADLDFSRPKLKLSSEEMSQIAEAIALNL